MLPSKVNNEFQTKLNHTNIVQEDGKEILDISRSAGVDGRLSQFDLARDDPTSKMSTSNSATRESIQSKCVIASEPQNIVESTQPNRSENISSGANKRTSKNFHPVEPFHHAYHVGKVLGKGGFGVVYEGTRIRDGLQVALKHISKSKITEYGQVSNYLSSIRIAIITLNRN